MPDECEGSAAVLHEAGQPEATNPASFGASILAAGGASVGSSVAQSVAVVRPPAPAMPVSPHPAPKSAASTAPTPRPKVETRLVAPMPGVIWMYEKNSGDEVHKGDVVLILEAMKMENLITAPVPGKVVALLCKEGDRVKKGAVLAVIG